MNSVVYFIDHKDIYTQNQNQGRETLPAQTTTSHLQVVEETRGLHRKSSHNHTYGVVEVMEIGSKKTQNFMKFSITSNLTPHI